MQLTPVGFIFSVAIFVFRFKERGVTRWPILWAMFNAVDISELGESAFASDVWR